MSATLPLLRVRSREIIRTWRLWVLPIVALFFAATGPVITRFTKDILLAALGSAEGGAAALSIPDPTALTSYARWTSDLSQLIVFIVVIMAAGAINSEVRSGVASLMLVKPVSRTAYVLTHAVAQFVFVALTVLLATLVNWGITAAIWTDAPLEPILAAAGVWIVLAAVLIAASLLASAIFDATAAAAGIGIGLYFALALLGMLPWLVSYTPVGLLSLSAGVAAGTQAADHALWWPLATGVLLAALLLAITVRVFQRKELR